MGKYWNDEEGGVFVSHQRRLRAFGLGLNPAKGGAVIAQWSLHLRHILATLREHLENRFIIVNKAGLYIWRGHDSRTVSDVFQSRNISCKHLLNGFVAFSGKEFLKVERKIRQGLTGGDFDFIDTTEMPPYRIFNAFRTRNIEFTYGEPALPRELGSTLCCHLHDGYMGGISIRDKALAPILDQRLLAQIVSRELRHLGHGNFRNTQPNFAPMKKEVWDRLRPILVKNGITGLRKDIHMEKDEIRMRCWAGYPERYDL